jgi:hypothetical protein
MANQRNVKHQTRDAQNLYAVVRANPARRQGVPFFKKKVAKQKIWRQGTERRKPEVNRPLPNRDIRPCNLLGKMHTYFRIFWVERFL